MVFKPTVPQNLTCLAEGSIKPHVLLGNRVYDESIKREPKIRGIKKWESEGGKEKKDLKSKKSIFFRTFCMSFFFFPPCGKKVETLPDGALLNWANFSFRCRRPLTKTREIQRREVS